MEEHRELSQTFENISQENAVLKQQLRQIADQNREFQECVSQMTSAVKTEQDKYHRLVSGESALKWNVFISYFSVPGTSSRHGSQGGNYMDLFFFFQKTQPS